MAEIRRKKHRNTPDSPKTALHRKVYDQWEKLNEACREADKTCKDAERLAKQWEQITAELEDKKAQLEQFMEDNNLLYY